MVLTTYISAPGYADPKNLIEQLDGGPARLRSAHPLWQATPPQDLRCPLPSPLHG